MNFHRHAVISENKTIPCQLRYPLQPQGKEKLKQQTESCAQSNAFLLTHFKPISF